MRGLRALPGVHPSLAFLFGLLIGYLSAPFV